MDNEILKTYEILEKIGEGSGGTVYKAYHKRMGTMVVLKRIINPKGSIEDNMREVNILKNLNHSYLPHVLDFMETDSGIFTVMSYVPGSSFQELLKQGRTFSKEDLLKWAMQMCSALHYLHTQPKPIIHGDIKPSNIMLTPQDDICLIDFNISTFLDERTVFGCTRGYTSPEQFWAVSSRRRNQSTSYVLDQKTDIYSVGATLYHMATGNVRADYEHEIDIRLLTQKIGPDFAAVIRKATALDPKMRYQSAYEMYQALQAIPEAGRQTFRKKNTRRANMAVIIAGVVLAAAILTGGVIAFKHHQTNVYADLTQHQKECIVSGDYAGEAEYYEQAKDKKPKEAESYYWHAWGYYSCGDYAGCINEIDNHIDEVKESSGGDFKEKKDLYMLKASAYLSSNADEEAADAFAKAEGFYELTPDENRQYATALARTGRNSEALEKLDKAEAADGQTNNPQSENTRGEIAREQGDRGGAETHFENCISQLKSMASRDESQESLLINAYASEADMFYAAGDKGKAMDLMRDADRSLGVSGRMIANRKLAAWSINAGNYSEAIRCYNTIIDLGHPTEEDLRNLGQCYVALGDSNKVRSIANDRKARFMNGTEDFYYFRLMALAEELDLNRTNDASKFYDYYYKAQGANRSDTQAAFNDLTNEYNNVRSKGY